SRIASSEGIRDEEGQKTQDKKIIKKLMNKFLKKDRKPPTKLTRPKTRWICKFFKLNEDNTKDICQISRCYKILACFGSPSTMKTHLSGKHQITRAIAIIKKKELKKSFSTI
ncbi:16525_t:CDS:2, partial [Funneliformis geosporum]